MTSVNKEFWCGKRVFLTGHTGFKGSWLSLWLYSMGAQVRGYSLRPPTIPSLFNEAQIDSIIDSHIGDIRDQETLSNSMTEFNPEILIHMAAQPLVRHSYDKPIETYEVNVLGTAKVLESARLCSRLKVIVNITTDKCYENDGRLTGYSEDDPMGGYDPYSSSKGCAELVASAYRRSFFQAQGVGLASARAGNVIGGGDWASDRLIPDILRSFERKEAVIVRNLSATRPWQHVLEPLSGYLILAQKMYEDKNKYSEGWNFGPRSDDVKPVEWILKSMTSAWPDSKWELDTGHNPHEANLLQLDINKSAVKLGWTPIWALNYTLQKIVAWHTAWLKSENARELCLGEIQDYMMDQNKLKSNIVTD